MDSPPPKSTRFWWVLALGFAAVWMLVIRLKGPGQFGAGGDLPIPSLTATGPTREADFRWTLRDLNDAPVEFAKFRGRTVFLNIWATWCPPCRAEMPAIANLADQSRLKDVAFVCVSTDESAMAVREYVADKHWPMTVLRATDLPEVFTTQGIPATFIIAADGRIVAAEVGSAQWDHPSVVNFLEKLAGAKVAPK